MEIVTPSSSRSSSSVEIDSKIEGMKLESQEEVSLALEDGLFHHRKKENFMEQLSL